jgi:hypothetical protein
MDNTPLQLPPTGVNSNFENPETRAPLVIALTVVCLVLMWPTFLMRLYTKLWIMRSFGLDDG